MLFHIKSYGLILILTLKFSFSFDMSISTTLHDTYRAQSGCCKGKAQPSQTQGNQTESHW